MPQRSDPTGVLAVDSLPPGGRKTNKYFYEENIKGNMENSRKNWRAPLVCVVVLLTTGTALTTLSGKNGI